MLDTGEAGMGDEESEEGEEGEEGERYGAGLPVTQSNDPLSGGHFTLGASKAPLFKYEI